MANLDVEIDEKTKWDIIDEVLYLEQENIKTEQRKDADMIREIVKIIKNKVTVLRNKMVTLFLWE